MRSTRCLTSSATSASPSSCPTTSSPASSQARESAIFLCVFFVLCFRPSTLPSSPYLFVLELSLQVGATHFDHHAAAHALSTRYVRVYVYLHALPPDAMFNSADRIPVLPPARPAHAAEAVHKLNKCWQGLGQARLKTEKQSMCRISLRLHPHPQRSARDVRTLPRHPSPRHYDTASAHRSLPHHPCRLRAAILVGEHLNAIAAPCT